MRIIIRLHYRSQRSGGYPSIGFRMYTDTNLLVTETSTWHHGIYIDSLGPGDGYLDLGDSLPQFAARELYAVPLGDRHARRYSLRQHRARHDVRSAAREHLPIRPGHRQPLRHCIFPAEVEFVRRRRLLDPHTNPAAGGMRAAT